jgi:3-phenylpropionate/trans-cinnamate dioxygenase ferredoxin reductase subunit
MVIPLRLGHDEEDPVGSGTVIIGASQAGLQLAVSLRELGDTEPITLVGAEAHPPYQRPPLSKEYLSGTADGATLAFRSASFYVENDIHLVCGERVSELTFRPGASGSRTARTANGRTFDFDRLALTVGAGPRRLEVPGADLDGVCYLRDLDDARQLRSELSEARRVVVVGGGFVGLEAAAVARARGLSVTVVEAADRLIARAVAPVTSEFYRRAHERRGTTVLVNSSVTEIRGNEEGRVSCVVLGDGTELPADLVMVGVGAQPRTELAEQIGLEVDDGIVVDAHARTSTPAIVAAGDCTVLPHPVTGEGRVRLESVNNAVTQATTAAATLMGKLDVVPTVPWFWSNQGDLRLQIAGLAAGFDDYVVRGDPDGERFSVLYYRAGRLLAVDAVNSPGDYMVVRRALAQGATIPAERADDTDVPLKQLLATVTAA